jgi:hypothetical protein
VAGAAHIATSGDNSRSVLESGVEVIGSLADRWITFWVIAGHGVSHLRMPLSLRLYGVYIAWFGEKGAGVSVAGVTVMTVCTLMYLQNNA